MEGAGSDGGTRRDRSAFRLSERVTDSAGLWYGRAPMTRLLLALAVLAACVAALTSGQFAYATGTVINADGGLLIPRL